MNKFTYFLLITCWCTLLIGSDAQQHDEDQMCFQLPRPKQGSPGKRGPRGHPGPRGPPGTDGAHCDEDAYQLRYQALEGTWHYVCSLWNTQYNTDFIRFRVRRKASD